MTTIDNWLTEATRELIKHDIESARLDVLLLLSDLLGRDKSWLLAHPEEPLSDELIAILNKKIIQRKQGLPLAYIRGFVEFYGRKFTVNERVLVPRPESEAIIECIKNMPSINNYQLIDVGTGSGVLAITSKLEIPTLAVTAVDIDTSCLQITAVNADLLAADISIIQSDLLLSVKTNEQNRPMIVVANLPYVPDNYPINYAAKHEPTLALFGGEDGLDLYRKLFVQCNNFLGSIDYVITESLLQQHQELAHIAKAHGFDLVETRGLAQAFQKA